MQSKLNSTRSEDRDPKSGGTGGRWLVVAGFVAALVLVTSLYAGGAGDLTTTVPAGVAPGVYCSTSSFSLSGNLNLTGSGVWIFKTVSTLITLPGSSVTGGDPCDVWWRIGSSATLDTTTSFIGNIL